MGRTKGSQNKEIKLPEEVVLSEEERISLLADILVEITAQELDIEVP